jgi:hypothetical protein
LGVAPLALLDQPSPILVFDGAPLLLYFQPMSPTRIILFVVVLIVIFYVAY